MNNIAIVIHGGAGNSHFQDLGEKELRRREDILSCIINEAYIILEQGGTALNSIINAVTALENEPCFNAGKGSALNANGIVEMDASLMDGITADGGGVSNIRTVKNPLLAAQAVMQNSPHTLLCGKGADDFAAKQGLDIVENSYFRTEDRVKELEDILGLKKYNANQALGTVGAAAIDKDGNMAAATSTGGLTGKIPGRVSDSSIIGAGTWAANGLCALSCTGTGDTFIRNATARDIAAMVEYKNLTLDEAFKDALKKIKAAGGSGGLIGVDRHGKVFMDFNTTGMYRGSRQSGQDQPFAAIL